MASALRVRCHRRTKHALTRVQAWNRKYAEYNNLVHDSIRNNLSQVPDVLHNLRGGGGGNSGWGKHWKYGISPLIISTINLNVVSRLYIIIFDVHYAN